MRRAFAGRGAKRAAILFKKIDSTLRGHVAAELAAARRSVGRRAVLFTPSFPAQRRVVRDARLFVDGKPGSGDLRALLSGAGLPAAQVDLATVRGDRLPVALRAALATGALGLACDAVTDADLDRIARAGLALRPRPLFVGSAGLAARARQDVAAQAPGAAAGHPAPPGRDRRRQRIAGIRAAGAAAGARSRQYPRADGLARERPRDSRSRRMGRLVAQAAPRVHYVLTGGETARAVLAARGIRELRLLGEVEPGVPFGMAPDGTLVCTKAGAFGKPGTLENCVARLKREMTRP